MELEVASNVSLPQLSVQHSIDCDDLPENLTTRTHSLPTKMAPQYAALWWYTLGTKQTPSTRNRTVSHEANCELHFSTALELPLLGHTYHFRSHRFNQTRGARVRKHGVNVT